MGSQRRLACKLGEVLGVPGYIDLEKLNRETAPQIGIVSVSYDANGQVGLMAVESGLHVLLETPDRPQLAKRCHHRGSAYTWVEDPAEQFHRPPVGAGQTQTAGGGLFGRV